MPKNRFQFSDDFVLNNGNVGIGSSVPQERLDVIDGNVKGENLKVTGVSSFTTYEGFLNANQNITENITLTSLSSSSLSHEVIVATGVTVTVSTVGLGTTTVGVGTTTDAGGTITTNVSTTNSIVSGQGNVDSLKVYNTFTVPVGGTVDRPPAPRRGMLFFNRDFATIEFYDGNVWKQVDNTTQSGRGIIAGGTTNSPAPSTIIANINYINLTTTGNSIDFGVLTTSRSQPSGASSSTRGVFAGAVGVAPTFTESNVIDYVTIASQGNSISFGSLPVATRAFSQGVSSSTRAIFAGGVSPGSTNVINYITISTLGNALDFGDLLQPVYGVAGTSSPTRGVWGGESANQKGLQFVTIASTGNTVQFGDLSVVTNDGGTIGNSVRGIFGGSDLANTNKGLSFITIATTGNGLDFGDMTVGRLFRGCSTQIRGVLIGGSSSPAQVNVIDYVTIAATGNAQDFGDLYTPLQQHGTCSDSHGGLGGF